MNKNLGVIAAVIVLVIAGVLVFSLSKNNKSNNSSTPPSSSSSSSNTTNAPSSTPSSQPTTTTPASSSFTVNANDDSADLTTLSVKKGLNVTVTFKVDQNGVYHGGLDFRSSTVSSGPIQPGQSKTVTFTADQSFDFTPYWYQSNVKKDYLISVKVN